jgi:NAD(P)-dependent dehydrogenase (short-subunit alcohol dehydrogenase family)
MRLQGKTALVTGGSHGIGKAIALRYAREGARVAISGRGQQALDDTVRQIREEGGEATAIVCDVQSSEQVKAMVRQVSDRWGEIHVLVNNAGICNEASFLEMREEDWDLHLNINLKGAFLVSQCVVLDMVKNSIRGSVINVSSVNGLKAEANQAHYNASKGGMNLLGMSMALELAPLGIRVNNLCPGFIETRLTKPMIESPPDIAEYLKSIPMQRVGQPDDLTGAAVFLASEDSLYMTGHNLVVDGGQVIKLD